MSLIMCPECGQQVSDKAKQCPKCAYPIVSMRKDGTVKIKFNLITYFNHTKMNGTIRVTESRSGKTLWEGSNGSVATFNVDDRTEIKIFLEGLRGMEQRVQSYADLTTYVEANKRYQVGLKGLSKTKKTGMIFGPAWLDASISEIDVIDSND